VREVMTQPVLCCRPEATMEECMALMTQKRIRHLPVTRGDEPVGVVTIGDLLAFQVEQQADTIQYLNSYVFDLR
jgi:CBS domain-containing protein